MMNGIAQFLEWLTSTVPGAIAITGHVVYLHDDCPHCDAQTLCEVSTLHQHYRCLECDRPIQNFEEHDGVPQQDERGLVAA